MAGGKAQPVILSGRERAALDRMSGYGSGRQAVALRAGIILLAVEGLSNRAIADRLQLEEHCVGRWRRRVVREGIWGLFDRPRSGRRASGQASASSSDDRRTCPPSRMGSGQARSISSRRI
jgi:hypothetical protein